MRQSVPLYTGRSGTNSGGNRREKGSDDFTLYWPYGNRLGNDMVGCVDFTLSVGETLMQIISKKGEHRIDPRHPQSTDPRYADAVKAGKERMARGELTFQSDAQ